MRLERTVVQLAALVALGALGAALADRILGGMDVAPTEARPEPVPSERGGRIRRLLLVD